jgi:hypothetical protein
MSLLRRGGIITDFALPSTAGGELFLSDVRGRSAMVLVLAATAPNAVRMLLREAAAQNARISTSEGTLCVAVAMPLRKHASWLQRRSGHSSCWLIRTEQYTAALAL